MNDLFHEDAEAQLTVAKKKESKTVTEGTLTVDVYQTEDEIIVQSTIAGVTRENVDISLTNDMVTIKGNRQPSEKIRASEYVYQELYWGPFSRSIILPVDVDADSAKAAMKDGILTIRMPKLEKTKTKRLRIIE